MGRQNGSMNSKWYCKDGTVKMVGHHLIHVSVLFKLPSHPLLPSPCYHPVCTTTHAVVPSMLPSCPCTIPSMLPSHPCCHSVLLFMLPSHPMPQSHVTVLALCHQLIPTLQCCPMATILSPHYDLIPVLPSRPHATVASPHFFVFPVLP